MMGAGGKAAVELEDPDGAEVDETDKDEDCEMVGDVVFVVEASMRSAQGGLVSWDLHREFCFIRCKASVAAGANDPPCALSVSSLAVV